MVEPLIHPGFCPRSEGAGVRRCGAPLPVGGKARAAVVGGIRVSEGIHPGRG